MTKQDYNSAINNVTDKIILSVALAHIKLDSMLSTMEHRNNVRNIDMQFGKGYHDKFMTSVLSEIHQL